MYQSKKLKLFNDPIYGFISISDKIIDRLVEHPSVQRLRRISQTGLTSLVYNGATHSRFNHAIGCIHLMNISLNTLRRKGIEITDQEEQAAKIAILLHDIGHGPYSHALELSLVNIAHEQVSLSIMNFLNQEFDGQISMAIQMFKGNYGRKFFYQLISSQIDLDRLDYLSRDSFYTGIKEGKINSERLIYMMNVSNNELVIEEKGTHSIEKFLFTRRLMYWQVYLHKTSLAAELMLVHLIKRVKFILKKDTSFYCPEPLKRFLVREINELKGEDLNQFLQLDDYDVIASIKKWQFAKDSIISFLSQSLINRRIFKVETKYDKEKSWEEIKYNLSAKISKEDYLSYLCYQGSIKASTYSTDFQPIMMLGKDGLTFPYKQDFFSSQSSLGEKQETKHYFCCPKEWQLNSFLEQ